MKMKHKKSGMWMLFIILLMAVIGISVNEAGEADTTGGNRAEVEVGLENTAQSTLEIHYIDVGQGDATLIKSGEQTMLIDAGRNSQGTKLQLYLNKQGIDHLDYLVLTHPDADHIGGADVIVTKYDIGTVFMGDFEKDGTTYEELLEALEYKYLSHSTPKVGSTYSFGEAEFTVLAPNGTYEDANNSSIALLLKHGENTFLFTGDCQEEAEADIMENGLDIDCDVYKVGHHGSKNASSKKFLEAVTPQMAVISCGENDYGHPHAEVLNHLREMGVKVYRTDEQGSIVAYSDGTNIIWNVAPSETWKAGAAATMEDTESTEDSTGIEGFGESQDVKETGVAEEPGDYIVANKNSGVFHKSTCKGLPAEKNRILFDTREEAIEAGFTNPCNYCRP